MRPDELNFRHLLYFWMVAKEGSITRAAERLGLSVQTISTQLGQLEQQLGQVLLAPQGRGLVLTEAGREAVGYAEQIFQLGDKLCRSLAEDRPSRPRLAVGVTDAVPKLVSFRLLAPLLQPPHAVQLECTEGDFETLLGELALNRLDAVVADRSAPHQANRKLHSHLMGKADIALFGTEGLRDAYATGFPDRLEGAPVLLPARTDALRSAIDAWFESHNIRPRRVGEFSDSALMKTFGRAGLGLFPAPAAMHADIAAQFGAYPLGTLQGVSENWYLISAHRRIQHPAVLALQQRGGAHLLG